MKRLKGIVVNRVCPSTKGGFLEITFTVPLILEIYFYASFQFQNRILILKLIFDIVFTKGFLWIYKHIYINMYRGAIQWD